MQALLNLYLCLHSILSFVSTFALTAGQDDSPCRNVFRMENQGTISSPNYPATHPPSLNCTWIISFTTEDCRYLEIHIVDLDLHTRSPTEPCNYNNFQIYDNIAKESLASYECGQEPPANLLRTTPSTSHSVKITINSNGNLEGRGFNITYKTAQPPDDYMMFVDTKGIIAVTEQNCLSSWILYNNTDRLLAAVAFDPSERIFYISDKNKKVISRLELIDWREPLRLKDDIVTEQIEDVTSLAIDSVNKRLYWTDSTLNTISTSRLDGSQRRELFTSDLTAPTNILLGPDCRYIYWTCGGTKCSTIERALVNGTYREKAESESDQGPFVLTIEGEILYRINTMTGTIRKYNLIDTFLTTARDLDSGNRRLFNATSAIAEDGILCWTSDLKTYCVLSSPINKVFEMSYAPQTDQLLYYKAGVSPTESSCVASDEPPLDIITTDRSTKVSSSTEQSEQLKTSLSTYTTNSPESKGATHSSSSTEQSQGLETTLPKYITNSSKSTKATHSSLSTEQSQGLETTLPKYITNSSKSTKATHSSSSTEQSQGLETTLPKYITNSSKSTKATHSSLSTEQSQELETTLPKYITNSSKSREVTRTSLSTKNLEQLKTSMSPYANNSRKPTGVTTLLPHKDAKNVSSATSHPITVQLWHVLLILILAISFCVGVFLIRIKYKRSTTSSFHLQYPDKSTISLLEKRKSEISTAV